MAFSDFIRKNYPEACRLQRGIWRDESMKSMLITRGNDLELVKSWMRDYGLFQGITSQVREGAAKKYLSVIYDILETTDATDRLQVRRAFETLFAALYAVKPRKWLSASSKLLWCAFPDNIVIYDSFVERSLIILQCLMPEISGHPRIGTPPAVNGEGNIASTVDFYMLYQDLVKGIYESNRSLLQELREQYSETYPHDIRILDKLLWMMGNPKQEIKGM